MSITIGLWILPTLIAVVTLAWAILTPSEPSSGYWNFDLMPLFRLLTAVIVSLFSWCVYLGIVLWLK